MPHSNKISKVWKNIIIFNLSFQIVSAVVTYLVILLQFMPRNMDSDAPNGENQNQIWPFL